MYWHSPWMTVDLLPLERCCLCGIFHSSRSRAGKVDHWPLTIGSWTFAHLIKTHCKKMAFTFHTLEIFFKLGYSFEGYCDQINNCSNQFSWSKYILARFEKTCGGFHLNPKSCSRSSSSCDKDGWQLLKLSWPFFCWGGGKAKF